MQYLKQKAAQDAVAEYQLSHPDPSEPKRLDDAQPGLTQPEQQVTVDEGQLKELQAKNEELKLEHRV